MKASFLVIRSIGAEFAHRLYFPIAVTVMVILFCLVGVSVWLTTLSSWWWVLCIVLIILTVIIGVVFAVIAIIIHAVAPVRSRIQKTQTKAFVDKLQRVSDVVQTPKIVLLFRIVRDIIWPRKNGFITSLSSDTTSLKKDFVELRDTFKQ